MEKAYIVCESLGLVYLFIILISSIFDKNKKQNKQKHIWFCRICYAVMLAVLSDLISWIISGKVNNYALHNTITAVSYVSTLIVYICFVFYLYYYIKDKANPSKFLLGAFVVYVIIASAITLIGCFSGWFYTLTNDGYYETLPGYSAYIIMNFLGGIFCLAVIAVNFRKIGKKAAFSAAAYILLPIFSAIVNLIFPQLELAISSMPTMILLIYINLQSEQEEALYENELSAKILANHDELTGLQNRLAFSKTIDGISGIPFVGVLFCDINALKYTNDHEGHHEGDKLLRKFSSILLEHFKASEIFRISGDEFVVIIPDISKDEFDKRTAVFAEKISSSEKPIASVGHAFGEGWDIQNVMNIAEKDMYSVKTAFHKAYPELERKTRS